MGLHQLGDQIKLPKNSFFRPKKILTLRSLYHLGSDGVELENMFEVESFEDSDSYDADVDTSTSGLLDRAHKSSCSTSVSSHGIWDDGFTAGT